MEQGTGKKQIWVFGQPKDKWKPNIVKTYATGKNLKIMVWGMVWWSKRSSLYIINRDFEAKKHEYSTNSYIKVLDAQVARHYTDDLWFVHDNAPIHTANKVKDWFKEQRVDVTDWPPYSPDLNPIEHAWKRLKEIMATKYPELMGNTSITEKARTEIEEALKAC